MESVNPRAHADKQTFSGDDGTGGKVPPDPRKQSRASEEEETGQRIKKACDRCAKLKVRCIPSQDNDDDDCERCAKSGEACAYRPRKKKRKSANKVAMDRMDVLEARIAVLEETLARVVSTQHSPVPANLDPALFPSEQHRQH